nr:MAG TPA: hypothetical protein [Caudoviricetes sp.]
MKFFFHLYCSNCLIFKACTSMLSRITLISFHM